MGYLAIERHAFYAMAIETSGQRQVHVRMRNKRLPWSQSYKTVRYLDTSQLPGKPPAQTGSGEGFHIGKLGGHNIQGMRQFLLGNRLIVASITDPNQIMTRSKVAAVLLAGYHALYPGFKAKHTVRLPNDGKDEAWFLFDPSRFGQKVLRRDSFLRLVKERFSRGETARGIFQGRKDRRNIYDQEKLVPIGMAYRLVYYGGTRRLPYTLPVDAEVERRVNRYLSLASGRVRGLRGQEDWYAIGSKPVAVLSKRRKTPRGRQMNPRSWTHGVGFTKVPDDKFQAKRPFMKVVARDSQEAQQMVTQRLKAIALTDRHKAATLAQQWLDADKLVIPRRIIDKYRK